MNFLIPFIAVLLLVATSTDVSANIRYVHARAVTSTDHYLDVVPIEETLTSSVMCVKLCATDVRCLSINYHKNKTCQLLDTFYCKDNTYVLKSESGFKYMDVDFNRQPDVSTCIAQRVFVLVFYKYYFLICLKKYCLLPVSI
ncbi:hypothetical protein SNE40_007676 [Patella caerulea]|uniref:Apple domain-containing protein n=1 Tax=Patella caerulea TaxID=87958 RepID=A0AAN8PXS4_PATCE